MEATSVSVKTCSECAFWNSKGSDQGECRVRPPQAMMFQVDAETKFETRFPVTAAQDWCGEFRAK